MWASSTTMKSMSSGPSLAKRSSGSSLVPSEWKLVTMTSAPSSCSVVTPLMGPSSRSRVSTLGGGMPGMRGPPGSP